MFEQCPTSITVNWTAIPDVNGYVLFLNELSYDLIGSDNASITLDGLIPGTSYSVTVRAYQDILGPPSMTVHVTTDDGEYIYAA